MWIYNNNHTDSYACPQHLQRHLQYFKCAQVMSQHGPDLCLFLVFHESLSLAVFHLMKGI